MCSIYPRARIAAPPSFADRQFSDSTRSAALVLAIFSLLAALSIFFAPSVAAQSAHYSCALTTRFSNSLASPASIAADAVGNLCGGSKGMGIYKVNEHR